MLSFFFLSFVGLVAQVGRFLKVLFSNGRFFLLIQLLDLSVQLLEIGWPVMASGGCELRPRR